jgi:integrase
MFSEPSKDAASTAVPAFSTLDVNVENVLNAVKAAGLEAEARFLLDLFLGAFADVSLAGAVIHWLSSIPVAEQLAVWGDDEPLLEPMARLSGYLAALPALTQDLPKPIEAFLAARSFRGQSDWYLATLLAVRQPYVEEVDRVWCERLRCWIFAQAVRQGMRGNFNDRFLKQVARSTQNAFDSRRYRSRLEFALGLHSDAVSLDALCFDLIRRAQRAKGDRLAPLASAIRAVAAGEQSPSPLSVGARWLVAGLPLKSIASPPVALSIFDATEGERLEAGGAVISTREPKTKSPRQTSNSARALLLARAEHLHYLPYSWANLPREQVDALAQTIDALLASRDKRHQLLGALAYLAILTASSIVTVGGVPIASVASDYWALHPGGAWLHRTPARSRVRWKATGEAAAWLAPLADVWRIGLPPKVVRALRRALREQAGAGSVGELWDARDGAFLEGAFNRACGELGFDPAGRLTSGRLNGVLTLGTYLQTHDSVLARLVISHPRTALPGSCSYPTWTSESVKQVLEQALPPPLQPVVDAGDAGANAAGSELDGRDDKVSATLGELQGRYLALAAQPDQWIARHNTLTSYCVIALLAATGARPTDSPFESPCHFNWKRGWVFVNDKSQDGGKQHEATGRVLPVAASALNLIATTYLGHLAALAAALAHAYPVFAREIGNLARRQGSDRLPFFFFLDDRAGLDWYAVRETSLKAVTGIRWPLPWNLFRKRLATRLRRSGLDPEVIDAVLGHAEAGVETYSDHSWRVPQADFSVAAPHLNASYEALALQPLPVFPIPAPTVPHTSSPESLPHRPFGIALRRIRRQQDQAQAREQAKREIEKVLGGRELSALSAEEVDALGTQMVLADKDVPHRHAALRYEVLEKLIATSWDEGKRVRRSRRDTLVPSGALSHAPEAVDAMDRLADVIRLYAGTTFLALKAPTAALLAAIDVCLMSRVSDVALLEAVRTRKDHRLVKLDGRCWLEYQAGLSEHPDQPVARIPLAAVAAQRVQTSLRYGAKGCRTLESVPKVLERLAAAIGLDEGATPQQLLSGLAQLVAAANSVELPRVLAAWLDGRLPSWGPLRADWIRFRTGSARQPHGRQEVLPSDDERAESGSWSTRADRAPPTGAQGFEQRVEAARQVIGEMNLIVGAWAEGFGTTRTRNAGRRDTRRRADPPAPSSTAPSREVTQHKLQQLVADAPAEAPTAAIALVEWAAELVSGKLVASSVQRYLGALAPRFRDFLHSEDLAELDADDLTEVYVEMVEARYDADGKDQQSAPPTSATSRYRRVSQTLNPSYVSARLREFHAFARRRFGLDDPDWSEIAVGGLGAAGSPGMIREAEYLHALTSIVGDVETAERSRLCHGMLLLLTYRFGLRGKEAHGLQRRDWVDHGEPTVVLVRSNAWRGLKTPAGQRQVPQLGELSPYERALIRRVLATWSALTDDPSKPLLCMDGSGALLLLRQMRRTLIASLQVATRNPRTNLHHARHTFANELGWALIAATAPGRDARKERWIDPDRARDLLLGTRGSTRRSFWALARAMGHASPATTLRSYFHLLPDLHAAYVRLPAEAPASAVAGDQIDDLDVWEIDRRYLEPTAVAEVAGVGSTAPSVEQIVVALRLLAAGKQQAAIADAIGVGVVGPVRNIRDGLEKVTAQLTRPRRLPRRSTKATGKDRRRARVADRDASRTGPCVRPELLPHIESVRWEALKAVAGRTKAPTPLLRDFDWEAALRLIRPSAHIVMWDEAHFRWVGAFLDALQLRHEVLVFETDSLDPQTVAWAEGAGFSERLPQRDGHGRRILQIDGVRDRAPEVAIRHRCAIVPRRGSVAATRYELVALWFAFVMHVRCRKS